MTDQLQVFKGQLNQHSRTIGSLMRGDEQERNRWMAEVTQAVMANPKLLACHRGSLILAIGTAAAMGLSVLPMLGEAWMIPRRRKIGGEWVQWVNFQIGYKGLVKLAYRSDDVESIYADVAYAGEPYMRRGGTDPRIEHEPDDSGELRTNRFDDIVAAYAIVWLKRSARPVFAAVAKSELARVRNSCGGKDGPSDVWRDHPEAMARKTAIIRVASRLPRTDRLRLMHRAVEHELQIEGGKTPPNMVPELEGIELGPERKSLAEKVAAAQDQDAEPGGAEEAKPE